MSAGYIFLLVFLFLFQYILLYYMVKFKCFEHMFIFYIYAIPFVMYVLFCITICIKLIMLPFHKVHESAKLLKEQLNSSK